MLFSVFFAIFQSFFSLAPPGNFSADALEYVGPVGIKYVPH